MGAMPSSFSFCALGCGFELWIWKGTYKGSKPDLYGFGVSVLGFWVSRLNALGLLQCGVFRV